MIQIRDSYFKAPDGNRYFRRNAPAVAVGSYGPKKEPLTQANYLAVEGQIKPDLLSSKIKKLIPIEVDWARESKTDVEASIKTFFDLGGTATFTHQKAIEVSLKLVRFHIEQAALESVLNKDAAKAREALKEQGKDARVCSSVWVAMSGELAERFRTAASIEAKGTTADGLTITANGGGAWRGSEKITLAPGTVFAYGLHKVDKWSGDKVDGMQDDWQSLG
jgi:hypothetical protein